MLNNCSAKTHACAITDRKPNSFLTFWPPWSWKFPLNNRNRPERHFSILVFCRPVMWIDVERNRLLWRKELNIRFSCDTIIPSSPPGRNFLWEVTVSSQHAVNTTVSSQLTADKMLLYLRSARWILPYLRSWLRMRGYCIFAARGEYYRIFAVECR